MPGPLVWPDRVKATCLITLELVQVSALLREGTVLPAAS